MDILSQVIQYARPRSCYAGATDVGGDLAIRFPAHDGAFFYSVAAGECWLAVDDGPAPICLKSGDCVVLPTGRPFILASDLRLPVTPSSVLFDHRPNGSIEAWNGGGGCMMFAAHFEFDAAFSRFLLSALQPVVRVREEKARADLRQGIDEMIAELQAGDTGCEIIVEHLAYIALVKVLRFHLSEAVAGGAGWLSALADTRLSGVIAAIQANPAQRWTVASLAKEAALSRTAFAVRFKAVTGLSPLQYLTRLRMLLAVNLLSRPGARLSGIAASLGYDSESAFSTAFRREMGSSPRQYAKHELGTHPPSPGTPPV